MSGGLPPLQPTTPADEWASSTVGALDDRTKDPLSAKSSAADPSTGSLLTAVPGSTTNPASTHSAIPPAAVPASTHAAIPATAIPASTHTAIPATAIPASTHTAIPATGIPASTHTTIPATATTHSTLSSTAPAPVYDPAVSTHDRFQQTGATAQPFARDLVETPGPQVPGAFPRTLSEVGSTQAAQQAQAALAIAQEKATQGAQVALTAAQGTLATAFSNAAQYLPQSVKEQVAPYLPEGTSVTANASHNDSVHATSYPSTELRGAQPGEVSGGVGALPGTSLESGVAQPENLVNVAGTTNPSLTDRAAAYIPQTVKDTAAPYLPAALAGSAVGPTVSASENDKVHATSLPTTEATGAGSGFVGGAGALPGNVAESGVAKPEELLNTSTGTTVPNTQPTLTERAAAYIPESVKAYVPAGIAGTAVGAGVLASEHDQHHKTSMPSTELTGAGSESVGGVGALPGRVGEESVAKLPEERVGSEKTDTMAGRYLGARDAVVGSAAAAASAVSRGTTVATDSAKHAAGYNTASTTAVAPHDTMSLPTTEHGGLTEGERVGGVGALPGSINETGVAVLPEENVKHTSTGPLTTSHSHSTGPSTTGISSTTGTTDNTTVPTAASTSATAGTTDKTSTTGVADKAADSISHAASKVTPNKTSDKTGTEHSSYGDDYHPAGLHPEGADYSNVETGEPSGTQGEKSSEGTAKTSLGASEATAGKERDTSVSGLKEGGDRKVHGGVPGDVGGGTMPVGDKHEGGVDSLDPKNKSGQHDRASTTASTTSSDAAHKPKFMDKLKGEMKILSGKITNKPEKVEEGQKLKTGSSPI